jgi:hypothetical protein
MELAWKYFSIPPVPYLPHLSHSKRYTLVMELDNVLIYYDIQSKLLKYRPYIDIFLTKLR